METEFVAKEEPALRRGLLTSRRQKRIVGSAKRPQTRRETKAVKEQNESKLTISNGLHSDNHKSENAENFRRRDFLIANDYSGPILAFMMPKRMILCFGYWL